MPGFETARRPIGRLPARRPPIGTAMPGRRIQAQPGDHGKGMSIARINRDPLPAAAASKAAQIAGTHRGFHQSCGPENIRNCPGTIISGIQKRLMPPAISIRARTKLVGCPDSSLHRRRSLRGRPGQSVTKTSGASRDCRSGGGKRIRPGRWNENGQDCCAKKSFKRHLIRHVLLSSSCHAKRLISKLQIGWDRSGQ
jgi:hypothetical protein